MNTTSSTSSEELRTRIEELLGDLTEMSPYRLSKIATVLVGSKVQGPMVYNYCDKKYIKSHKNTLDHFVVTREDAAEWLLKYGTKKLGIKE